MPNHSLSPYLLLHPLSAMELRFVYYKSSTCTNIDRFAIASHKNRRGPIVYTNLNPNNRKSWRCRKPRETERYGIACTGARRQQHSLKPPISVDFVSIHGQSEPIQSRILNQSTCVITFKHSAVVEMGHDEYNFTVLFFTRNKSIIRKIIIANVIIGRGMNCQMKGEQLNDGLRSWASTGCSVN